MNRVLIGKRDDPHMNVDVIESMLRLRHKVFKQRLGWEVASWDGMEIDRYDQLNPVYIICTKMRRIAEGCLRLLPTTGDYMLKNIFPVLLRGETAPSAPQIWEISRFTVASNGSGCRQMNLGRTTHEMMCSVEYFADRVGVEQFITVISIALERLLLKIGMPVVRFGDGKTQLIGKVRSVACWIPVNDAFREAIGYGNLKTNNRGKDA